MTREKFKKLVIAFADACVFCASRATPERGEEVKLTRAALLTAFDTLSAERDEALKITYPGLAVADKRNPMSARVLVSDLRGLLDRIATLEAHPLAKLSVEDVIALREACLSKSVKLRFPVIYALAERLVAIDAQPAPAGTCEHMYVSRGGPITCEFCGHVDTPTQAPGVCGTCGGCRYIPGELDADGDLGSLPCPACRP